MDSCSRMSSHLHESEDFSTVADAPLLGSESMERLREDRSWAETVLAGENRVLEMIAGNHALPSILDALCRLVEEMSDGALCSILLMDSEGKHLRHGAAPSLPKSYSEAIDGGLIGPRAGSCGTAAFRRELVVVSDIATDPLWEQYRHLTMAHGLR